MIKFYNLTLGELIYIQIAKYYIKYFNNNW